MSTVVAFAPGRVNLLGEHTDYNGGLALPFAIARGVTVRATALPGPLVMARARDLGETEVFDVNHPGDPVPGWRGFVRGVAAELAWAGHRLRPARLEISGDVPRGAGLSSSAALSVSLALAMLGIAGAEPPPPLDLARLCCKVENEWVHVRTGLLDQLAALHGRPGTAVLIDFETLAVEPVPLVLDGWTLAVCNAGPRDLAASGYNDRRRECEEGHEARLRHVASENARVLEAVAALRRGDVAALGPLLDASHASLRDDFEVSNDAVEAAVARCKAAGAAGARLIGGGFGGSVLALFAPGIRPPAGALSVAPAAGASLLH